MNKTIIVITGAMAVSLGLSGCVATGQSSANYMAAPAQQVSSAEHRSTPEFADEQLADRYASLLKRYREFRHAESDYLEAGTPSACELNRTGEWLVTHGKPENEIRDIQGRTNGQFQLKSTTTIESVSLIEGECRDGMPEGPFVGIGQYRQVVDSENGNPSRSSHRVRMEGTATDGRMDGDFTFFSKSDTAIQVDGQPVTTTTLSASTGKVENGRDVGSHLIITGQDQTEGFATLVRTSRQTAMGPHTEIQSYTGSRLTLTMNQLNHVSHGWTTNHLMPDGQKRTCMFQGEPAEDSRCASLSLPAIASESIPEDALEQLVRNDNQGEYMSPYTSDGVLAEWVNIGSNASIGGTVGSGVGAAAGGMIADKALESVPFGGLIGSIVGSKAGEEVGREAGISASGGWETIRASSDQSFDSLTDMARYLAQKYGNEPTYGDAIQVTLQVYPELQNAMASAY